MTIYLIYLRNNLIKHIKLTKEIKINLSFYPLTLTTIFNNKLQKLSLNFSHAL